MVISTSALIEEDLSMLPDLLFFNPRSETLPGLAAFRIEAPLFTVRDHAIYERVKAAADSADRVRGGWLHSILAHAEYWAALMEERLQRGEPLTGGLIDACYLKADNRSQLSAQMDNLAALLLREVWLHGGAFAAVIEKGQSRCFSRAPWSPAENFCGAAGI